MQDNQTRNLSHAKQVFETADVARQRNEDAGVFRSSGLRDRSTDSDASHYSDL